MAAADEQSDAPQEKPWRPLDVRTGETSVDEYDALHEGIPHWLENSLWRWVRDRGAAGGMALVYRAERKLRVSIGLEPGLGHGADLIDEYWTVAGPAERLRLVDFLLGDLSDGLQKVAQDPAKRDEAMQRVNAYISLGAILSEAGSAWTVGGQGHWGLVRRLNETSHEAVKQAASYGNDAGTLIKRAWHACYQYEPNFALAYRDAVLAVESVACTVMTPHDQKPSLGKAITHLKDTTHRWTVAGLDAQVASGNTLLSMLQTLWHNHQRHVQQGGTMPSDVTQQEAEAAVSLAVTLVQWFSAGLVETRKGT